MTLSKINTIKYRGCHLHVHDIETRCEIGQHFVSLEQSGGSVSNRLDLIHYFEMIVSPTLVYLQWQNHLQTKQVYRKLIYFADHFGSLTSVFGCWAPGSFGRLTSDHLVSFQQLFLPPACLWEFHPPTALPGRPLLSALLPSLALFFSTISALN